MGDQEILDVYRLIKFQCFEGKKEHLEFYPELDGQPVQVFEDRDDVARLLSFTD